MPAKGYENVRIRLIMPIYSWFPINIYKLVKNCVIDLFIVCIVDIQDF